MLAGLCFALPWALVALRGGDRTLLLVALTTLALSLGGLTLWLLVLALAGALTPGAAVGGLALLSGAGFVVAARQRALYLPPLELRPRSHPVVAGMLVVVLVMAVLIAFNAVYWPFSDADAVAIYADHSRAIFEARAMPEGEGLYESYPMLLPLGYVYGYLLAGHINEYLAGIVVAALGAGTLGAAFALGRTLYDAATGALAALLLALTPSFTRWGSSGYTDIPAAFFVTLALVFAARLARSAEARHALLLGIMAGLAAWTKNSALPVAGSLVLWPLGLWWAGRVTWRTVGIAVVGLALTAGPWYLRNVLLWGHIVAPTVWSDLARHTLRQLVPFVTYPQLFFLPGIVYTLGLAWGVVAAWRGPGPDRDAARLLLLAIVPFAAVWWWMASYDTRFLLVVLPGVAVLGARMLAAMWSALVARYPRAARPGRVPLIVLLAAIVALSLPAARKAVTYKGDLLRDPLMDDQTRHRIALGPVYDVARYLDALPAAGRLLTDNHFLPFHAAQESRLEVIVGGLPRRDALARYDYLVFAGRLPDAVQPQDITLLAEIDGFRVYEVIYR